MMKIRVSIIRSFYFQMSNDVQQLYFHPKCFFKNQKYFPDCFNICVDVLDLNRLIYAEILYMYISARAFKGDLDF